MAKSEKEAKKLILPRFYKWIKVSRKKANERTLMRKMWDYAIEVREEFVPRKGKIYPLFRGERGEVCEFINEQLRKRYIRPSKSSQIVVATTRHSRTNDLTTSKALQWAIK